MTTMISGGAVHSPNLNSCLIAIQFFSIDKCPNASFGRELFSIRASEALWHCRSRTSDTGDFAYSCFFVAYLAPNTKYGQVALHCGLVVGFLVLSTWAWNVICAPDVFAWYLAFTSLNIGQLLYILYTMRPIR